MGKNFEQPINLIVGDKSQISYYFPDDFLRISSRNVEISNNKIKNTYICFAEQRTYDTTLSESDFIQVNVEYTSQIIEMVKNISEKVIIFGTGELWNKLDGPIDLESKIDYKYSPYLKSKHILYETMIEKRCRGDWQNIIMIHPFNFNSVRRRSGFLFYKVFDSLINRTTNQVGNLDINRDMLHPIYLVEQILQTKKDRIIGSGKLTNIKQFISELYLSFGISYEDYLKENIDNHSVHQHNSFWSKNETIYENLLSDTIKEINKWTKSN